MCFFSLSRRADRRYCHVETDGISCTCAELRGRRSHPRRERMSESGFAFPLVLTAAALHVSWPMLVVAPPDPALWHVIIASGAVHAAANVAIAQAYVRADFSVAYPVARGLSALLGAFTGTLLLDERLPALGWVGVALTAVGVAWIGLAARTTSGHPSA